MLQLNVYEKGKYQVVRINQDVGRETDITELNSVVGWLLDRGKRSIAVHFTPESFLSTSAVSLFAECMDMVFQAKGKLAIINPGRSLSEFMAGVSFDHTTSIYASENELVSEEVAA